VNADAIGTMLREQVQRVEEATRQGLDEAGDYLEGEIKTRLSATSHAAGTPTPSMPGEPPSMVSGALRDSVENKHPTGGNGHYETKVGPDTPYARIQELGGDAGIDHSAHLDPRPYVAPSIEAARGRIEGIMVDHWSEALNG
jgi:phage gpG-like protein